MRTIAIAIAELEQPITWQLAHATLTRLAKQRAAADAEEGRWLLAARRAAAHVHCGFGSFNEYIEWLFGYQPRSVQEKLRVAAALETLPALERALSEGDLNWSATRELARVVVAETETEWLEFARGKTARQLTEVLSGKHPGDLPSAPPDLAARRHVLRFDVSAETYALVRDALAELRRRSGTSLDDDTALLEMARNVLGGPNDDGRAPYQVALSVCPQCASGQQHTQGAAVAVEPSVVAQAQCDAQCIPEQPVVPANDATPASKRAHAGAHAKQSIPPALRRAVLLRDQRRCQVPGCRNHRFLDIHHLELRSEGGSNSAHNLVSVCGAHHRAAHRGELQLELDADGSLRARHADGSDYGRLTSPEHLDTHAKVFSALRNLGFREGEVRAALRELQRDHALREAPFDQLLRKALAQLRAAQHER